MMMGWFPSADSWGHSSNSQGALFLYHPYHMLTALYLLYLQSCCQYIDLFFPPDFSWKEYQFQVVNHPLSQGTWFLGRAPSWTPCGGSRETFWGSCFTLKLCCSLPLSQSRSWLASDTFGRLKKKKYLKRSEQSWKSEPGLASITQSVEEWSQGRAGEWENQGVLERGCWNLGYFMKGWWHLSCPAWVLWDSTVRTRGKQPEDRIGKRGGKKRVMISNRIIEQFRLESPGLGTSKQVLSACWPFFVSTSPNHCSCASLCTS